jgi:polysaccharide export outer membrane protein
VLFRTVDGKRFGGVFDVRAIRSGKASDPAVLGNDIVVVGLSNAKSIWRDVVTTAPILNVLRPIGF